MATPHPSYQPTPPHDHFIPIFGIHIDLPIPSELPAAAIPEPQVHTRPKKSAPQNPHPMTTRALWYLQTKSPCVQGNFAYQ